MNRKRTTYRLFLVLFIAYFALYGISPIVARTSPATTPQVSSKTPGAHQASVTIIDRAIIASPDTEVPDAAQAGQEDDYILLKKKRAVLTKKGLIDPHVIEKGRTEFLDYLFSSFDIIAVIVPAHHSLNPADGLGSAHSGLSPPAV